MDRIAEEKNDRATSLAIATFYDAEADRRAAWRDFDNAVRFSERALSIRRRLGLVEEAEGLNNMGQILARQGRFDEALKKHMQALSLQSKELPSEDVKPALTHGQIGEMLVEKKDFLSAENFLLESLSILDKALGTYHLEVSLE
ncbi:MAG: tetratricopeptide repeat protein [Planctomycetota bacterium]